LAVKTLSTSDTSPPSAPTNLTPATSPAPGSPSAGRPRPTTWACPPTTSTRV
jgi:hypothetical protein